MELDIFTQNTLPRWLKVRQPLYTQTIGDIDQAVAVAFTHACVNQNISPGQKVAITAGSRGIDRIAEVIRAVVAQVKQCGAEPFVVPAMGSHGGSTSAGQRDVLAHYGVTEEYLQAPIRSSLEVVQIGNLADGLPVFFDRIAATEADLVIPIGRVKPHTDFHGPIESGLCKMIAIGLSKQHGANTLHNQGFSRFPELIPAVAQFTLAKIPIPFGVALVENGLGKLALLEVVPAQEILTREPELLIQAREMMPHLPGEALDVLMVDYLGKDISGIGADTNVVNRYYNGPLPFKPSIQRLVVRNLTEDTNGNASGLGLADVALRQAVNHFDPIATYMNCITARTPEGARIPLTVDNDRQALHIALACCLHLSTYDVAKVARIRDTKHLETFYVSEPFYQELVKSGYSVEALEAPHEIKFDADGMFVD